MYPVLNLFRHAYPPNPFFPAETTIKALDCTFSFTPFASWQALVFPFIALTCVTCPFLLRTVNINSSFKGSCLYVCHLPYIIKINPEYILIHVSIYCFLDIVSVLCKMVRLEMLLFGLFWLLSFTIALGMEFLGYIFTMQTESTNIRDNILENATYGISVL